MLKPKSYRLTDKDIEKIDQLKTRLDLVSKVDVIRRAIDSLYSMIVDNVSQAIKPPIMKSELNIYEGWAAKTAPPQYLKMNGSKNAFFVDGSDSNKYMVVITDGKKEVTLDEDSPYFNQFK